MVTKNNPPPPPLMGNVLILKNQERLEIEREMSAFLAGGGKPQQIPFGESYFAKQPAKRSKGPM